MSTAADKRALAKAAAGESLRRTALRRAAMYTSPGVPRDVLAGLSAPLRFEGGGLAAALAFAAPGSPNFAALIAELLDLTRANMRALYEAAPGWGGWRDGKKRGELLDADSRFIVARGEGPAGGGGGALLGFACFRFLLDGERDVLYLFELQLAEAAQRKGLGRHLMLLCEQVARAAGMQSVVLTVLKNNAAAVQFYARLGYALDETSPEEGKAPYEIRSKALATTTASGGGAAAALPAGAVEPMD